MASLARPKESKRKRTRSKGACADENDCHISENARVLDQGAPAGEVPSLSELDQLNEQVARTRMEERASRKIDHHKVIEAFVDRELTALNVDEEVCAVERLREGHPEERAIALEALRAVDASAPPLPASSLYPSVAEAQVSHEQMHVPSAPLVATVDAESAEEAGTRKRELDGEKVEQKTRQKEKQRERVRKRNEERRRARLLDRAAARASRATLLRAVLIHAADFRQRHVALEEAESHAPPPNATNKAPAPLSPGPLFEELARYVISERHLDEILRRSRAKAAASSALVADVWRVEKRRMERSAYALRNPSAAAAAATPARGSTPPSTTFASPNNTKGAVADAHAGADDDQQEMPPLGSLVKRSVVFDVATMRRSRLRRARESLASLRQLRYSLLGEAVGAAAESRSRVELRASTVLSSSSSSSSYSSLCSEGGGDCAS